MSVLNLSLLVSSLQCFVSVLFFGWKEALMKGVCFLRSLPHLSQRSSFGGSGPAWIDSREVVKVIWDKATSPLHVAGSLVLARWRQCVCYSICSNRLHLASAAMWPKRRLVKQTLCVCVCDDKYCLFLRQSDSLIWLGWCIPGIIVLRSCGHCFALLVFH